MPIRRRTPRALRPCLSLSAALRALPALLAVLCLSSAVSAAAAGPDDELLARAERSRGCTAAPLAYTIELEAAAIGQEAAVKSLRHYSVESQGPNAIVTWLDPTRPVNGLTLLVNSGVWRHFGGTAAQPSILPPRDRVTGLVQIGDVIATCFSTDYKITGAKDVKDGGVTYRELALEAKGARMVYRLASARLDPAKGLITAAKYYTDDQKVARDITFTYGQSLVLDGKPLPFLSTMHLTSAADALPMKTITWGPPKLAAFDAAYFDVAHVVARRAAAKAP